MNMFINIVQFTSSCEDCGKSFVHKKVLDSHKTIHSEERPFVCQTCGKAFRQQSALYIHNRCHLPDTVKNRYPCDQCDKRLNMIYFFYFRVIIFQ